MKLFKYTEKQLREAVKESLSKRQVLLRLGVAPYGGNYEVLRRAIKYFAIDTEHFTGMLWNKGRKLGNRYTLDDYLSGRQTTTSHRLRLRLINEGVFEHKCSNCKNVEWMDNAIPLELDHIDGDNKNNILSNLRLLCPNCHALTSNYRGKNKSKT